MIYSLKKGLLKPEEAVISLESESLQFGFGLFETMKSEAGKVFLLESHLIRLDGAAKNIELELGASTSEMGSFVSEVAKSLPPQPHRLKLMATTEGLFVVATPLSVDFQKTEISLLPTPSNRALPEVKSFNYLDCLLSYQKAKKAGFDDALLLACKDRIREASRGNIFWVRSGQLFTSTHRALEGITQGFLLEQYNSVEVAEITLSELLKVEEVFYTNSIQGVCPVVRIGQSGFKAGPVTKKVQDFYLSQSKGLTI